VAVLKNYPNNQITRIRPKQTIDQILEVNSGFIEKNNIQVGDKVVLTTED